MSGAFSERSRRQDDVCMRHRHSMHSMRVMADQDTLHSVLHVVMLLCSILSPVWVRQNIVLFLVMMVILVGQWSHGTVLLRILRPTVDFSRAAYIASLSNRSRPATGSAAWWAKFMSYVHSRWSGGGPSIVSTKQEEVHRRHMIEVMQQQCWCTHLLGTC